MIERLKTYKFTHKNQGVAFGLRLSRVIALFACIKPKCHKTTAVTTLAKTNLHLPPSCLHKVCQDKVPLCTDRNLSCIRNARPIQK